MCNIILNNILINGDIQTGARLRSCKPFIGCRVIRVCGRMFGPSIFDFLTSI
jgi:hypothetical protein